MLISYTQYLAKKRRYHHKAICRKVSIAVSGGHLFKPKECACGKSPVQAHHTDYSKPLEVEWLCKDCHRSRHIPKVVIPDNVWLTKAGIKFMTKKEYYAC